jgi:hypothetical protein
MFNHLLSANRHLFNRMIRLIYSAIVAIPLAVSLLLGGCATYAPVPETETRSQVRFLKVQEMPQGVQAYPVLNDFFVGVRSSTTVGWTFPAPHARVWEICKAAAERLDKEGKRPVVAIDEKKGRIRAGQITTDIPPGLEPGTWTDEFLIEALPLPGDRTRVSVTRRVLKYGGSPGNAWRNQWSNGKIEWWILTYIQDVIEGRKSLKPAPVPKPPPPAPRPEPPSPAPVQPFGRLEPVSVEIIKIPMLELVKSGTVRSQPNLKSRALAKVAQGAQFPKVAKRGEWYGVELSPGNVGWIHKSLIRQLE